MAGIGQRVATLHAEALLRARPVGAPPISGDLFMARTIDSIDVGSRVPLVSLTVQEPALLVVQAVAEPSPTAVILTTIAPPFFELAWSVGGRAEAPVARFNNTDPITLFARTVNLLAVNPPAVQGGDSRWRIHASVGLVKYPLAPARPLWANLANLLGIAFGVTQGFQIGPYTRRIRVARLTPATPFTVREGFASSTLIPANGEYSWKEVTGWDQVVQVTNNAGAGSDNFQVFEELAL